MQLSNLFKIKCKESNKPIIVHNHIFKNAGSSLDKILQINFKKRFQDNQDNLNDINDLVYLSNLIKKNNLRSISSHSFYGPIFFENLFTSFNIVLLRNPIHRILSAYEFERKQDINIYGSFPAVVKAHQLNFKGYILWRLDQHHSIRNFQFKKMTRDGNLLSAKKKLSKADIINVYNKYDFVGVVELFDSSIKKLKNSLAHFNIDLKVMSVKYNVNNALSEIDDRDYFVKNELGSSLYAKLISSNKYDFQLHDYALQKVN